MVNAGHIDTLSTRDGDTAPDAVVPIKVIGRLDKKFIIKVPGVLAAKIVSPQVLSTLTSLGFNVINDPDQYTI